MILSFLVLTVSASFVAFALLCFVLFSGKVEDHIHKPNGNFDVLQFSAQLRQLVD